MGKIVILCAKCGANNWIADPNPRDKHDKICGNCGADYCAKNREYKWIEEGE